MQPENPLRILVVDDDEEDFIILRELLHDIDRTRYELTWRADYDEALVTLSSLEHDAGLVDYRLRGRTGLELLQDATRIGCDVPLIMLTGMGDPAIDIAAMAAGATDYLLKGKLDPTSLERALRYAVERKRAERELRHLACALERQNRRLVEMHEELMRKNAELCVPILPLSETIVLIPILGTMDQEIADRLLAALLPGIAAHSTKVAILDFTGVPAMDRGAAAELSRIASAARMLGANTVITGVRPAVANVLANLEAPLPDIAFCSTLMSGISFAISKNRAPEIGALPQSPRGGYPPPRPRTRHGLDR